MGFGGGTLFSYIMYDVHPYIYTHFLFFFSFFFFFASLFLREGYRKG